ncbi:actin-related protein 3-beta-like isoform 1 [Reticulomyxa filosa]|uniref:Actin-related protein 3-beta-like isoform 1 n=1 Tax=Reticulomyxa filosa TaxID=46433 RepID=X6P3G4_RETFI|nr:actin-related protein 3-beta-like isoform 1 [Reticulomyxa filosa]|eukprot:ETO32668.1 actin-related protein 3-beta-like isoform 1 [Reticulomyxa filosa]
MTTKPPIVIDNGTGFTKMGYAGNTSPDYMVPTVIAQPEKKAGGKQNETADLEFYIGNDALDKRLNYTVSNCLEHGIIEDWDKEKGAEKGKGGRKGLKKNHTTQSNVGNY